MGFCSNWKALSALLWPSVRVNLLGNAKERREGDWSGVCCSWGGGQNGVQPLLRGWVSVGPRLIQTRALRDTFAEELTNLERFWGSESGRIRNILPNFAQAWSHCTLAEKQIPLDESVVPPPPPPIQTTVLGLLHQTNLMLCYFYCRIEQVPPCCDRVNKDGAKSTFQGVVGLCWYLLRGHPKIRRHI